EARPPLEELLALVVELVLVLASVGVLDAERWGRGRPAGLVGEAPHAHVGGAEQRRTGRDAARAPPCSPGAACLHERTFEEIERPASRRPAAHVGDVDPLTLDLQDAEQIAPLAVGGLPALPVPVELLHDDVLRAGDEDLPLLRATYAIDLPPCHLL